MRFPSIDPNKSAHKLTMFAVLFIACIGLIMVFFPVKPFWVDEWFIISSLKTRDNAGLLGQLDFMQQFPRVYLVLVHIFVSWFHYSYTALRLPSFIVSMAAIAVSYSIMKQVWPKLVLSRYLFVLILASSFTFCEYFVEVKQYPMDILLSVVALWQLIEIMKIKPGTQTRAGRYILLCASFLIVPFFSYTYPIAAAPVYVVVLLQSITLAQGGDSFAAKRSALVAMWSPLAFCTIGILLFYIIDARQLATDKCMYGRWDFLLIDKNNRFVSFLTGVYTLFSQTGAGLLYETIFGILGLCSFVTGTSTSIRSYLKKEQTLELQLRMYSCLLIMLVIILFLLKKLPLGTPRLNAFTTASIAILVIYLVNRLLVSARGRIAGYILVALLYVGLACNIFAWYIQYFTSEQYQTQMAIYNATQSAIGHAQNGKMPILITRGITYPYEQATIDAGATDPGVWVIKTFPAYDVHEHLPVYEIKDTAAAKDYLAHLPPNISSVLAGDGIYFAVVHRKGAGN